jgi:hypothetical protein
MRASHFMKKTCNGMNPVKNFFGMRYKIVWKRVKIIFLKILNFYFLLKISFYIYFHIVLVY